MSLPDDNSPATFWDPNASLRASQLEIRNPESPVAIARIAPATPSGTYGTDGESDSIRTLMSRNRKKKPKRAGTRLSTIDSAEVHDGWDQYSVHAVGHLTHSDTTKDSRSVTTPLTAFHDAVATNTGFSPINPSAPLPDALGPIPATPVAAQPPPMLRPTPAPAPKIAKVPSLPPLPPSIPATPIVYRPAYREVRPRLFQDAFLGSVNGVKFDDTQIRVFSARTKAGVAHKPRTLHARGAFLQAASAKFEDGEPD